MYINCIQSQSFFFLLLMLCIGNEGPLGRFTLFIYLGDRFQQEVAVGNTSSIDKFCRGFLLTSFWVSKTKKLSECLTITYTYLKKTDTWPPNRVTAPHPLMCMLYLKHLKSQAYLNNNKKKYGYKYFNQLQHVYKITNSVHIRFFFLLFPRNWHLFTNFHLANIMYMHQMNMLAHK